MDVQKANSGSGLDPKHFNAEGKFIRSDSTFRNFISSKDNAEYPMEEGRYHIYINMACPWANGVLAMMHLKGLQHAFTWSTTAPVWGIINEAGRTGWVFDKAENCRQAEAFDHVNGFQSVAQVYWQTDPNYNEKFTVPVIFDKKTNKIVNNESSEIIKMMNSEMNQFAKNKDLNIYPESLRAEIDGLNEWIYNDINNGVYKTGFAKTQQAYEEAFDALFSALDKADQILETQQYLVGDKFTYIDLRLFMTLIRFDPVYVVHFKCNKKCIEQYKNLSRFVRHIYNDLDCFSDPNEKGLKKLINMEHIKKHYYGTHKHINPFLIVAKGPDAWWEKPN